MSKVAQGHAQNTRENGPSTNRRSKPRRNRGAHAGRTPDGETLQPAAFSVEAEACDGSPSSSRSTGTGDPALAPTVAPVPCSTVPASVLHRLQSAFVLLLAVHRYTQHLTGVHTRAGRVARRQYLLVHHRASRAVAAAGNMEQARQDLLLRELGEAQPRSGGVAHTALPAPVSSSRGDAGMHAAAHASSCSHPAPPLAPPGKLGTLCASQTTSPITAWLQASGAPLGDSGDEHVSGTLVRWD